MREDLQVAPFSQAAPNAHAGVIPFFSSSGLDLLQKAMREGAGILSVLDVASVAGLTDDPGFQVSFDAVPPWTRGSYPMLARSESLAEYESKLALLERKREYARLAASAPGTALAGELIGSVVGDPSNIASLGAAALVGRSTATIATVMAGLFGAAGALDVAATSYARDEPTNPALVIGASALSAIFGSGGTVALMARNRLVRTAVDVRKETIDAADAAVQNASSPAMALAGDESIGRFESLAGPTTVALGVMALAGYLDEQFSLVEKLTGSMAPDDRYDGLIRLTGILIAGSLGYAAARKFLKAAGARQSAVASAAVRGGKKAAGGVDGIDAIPEYDVRTRMPLELESLLRRIDTPEVKKRLLERLDRMKPHTPSDDVRALLKGATRRLITASAYGAASVAMLTEAYRVLGEDDEKFVPYIAALAAAGVLDLSVAGILRLSSAPVSDRAMRGMLIGGAVGNAAALAVGLTSGAFGLTGDRDVKDAFHSIVPGLLTYAVFRSSLKARGYAMAAVEKNVVEDFRRSFDAKILGQFEKPAFAAPGVKIGKKELDEADAIVVVLTEAGKAFEGAKPTTDYNVLWTATAKRAKTIVIPPDKAVGAMSAEMAHQRGQLVKWLRNRGYKERSRGSGVWVAATDNSDHVTAATLNSFFYEFSEGVGQQHIDFLERLGRGAASGVLLNKEKAETLPKFLRRQSGPGGARFKTTRAALAHAIRTRNGQRMVFGVRNLRKQEGKWLADIELLDAGGVLSGAAQRNMRAKRKRMVLPGRLRDQAGKEDKLYDVIRYVAARSALAEFGDDFSARILRRVLYEIDEGLPTISKLIGSADETRLASVERKLTARKATLDEKQRKALDNYWKRGGAVDDRAVVTEFQELVRDELLRRVAQRKSELAAERKAAEEAARPVPPPPEANEPAVSAPPQKGAEPDAPTAAPEAEQPKPEAGGGGGDAPRAEAGGEGAGTPPPEEPPGSGGPTPPPVPDTELLKLKSALGLEKLPVTPWLRVVQSRFGAARDIAWRLVTSPGMQSIANSLGFPAPVAVETRIKMRFWPLVEAQRETERLYLRYVGRDQEIASVLDYVPGRARTVGLVAASAAAKLKRREVLSFRAFRERVGKAMLAFDEDAEIPEVAAAAKKWRKLLEDTREEAADLGLFDLPHRVAADRFNSMAASLARWIERRATNPNMSDFEVDLTSPAFRAYIPRHLRQKIVIKDPDVGVKVLDILQGAAKASSGTARRIKMLKGKILPEGESYFPRVWKAERIRAERSRFRRILVSYFERTGRKVEVTDELTGEQVDLVDQIIERLTEPQPFRRTTEDATGYATGLHERVLKDLKSSEVIDFIDLDVATVLRGHLRQMWADIEITREFGSPNMWSTFQFLERQMQDEAMTAAAAAVRNGASREEAQAVMTRVQKEAQNVLTDLRALRDRLRGTYGLPDDPYHWMYRTLRSTKQLNAMLYLGVAPISAVVDVARPIMAWGFQSFAETSLNAISGAIRRVTGESAASAGAMERWRREAEMAGAALETAMAERALAFSDSFDPYGKKTWFERAIAGAHGVYFQVLGLLQWSDMMKTWASMITGHKVISMILESEGISELDAAKLARAHIGQQEIERLRGMLARHAEKVDGVWHPNTAAWEDLEAAKLFRAMLIDEADRIVVTPGAADRPLFMSKQLGSLITQFKSFGMAATWRVLAGGIQDADASAFLVGSTVAILAAYISGEMKAVAKDSKSRENTRVKVYDAIDASSIFGFFSDAFNIMEGMTGVGPRELFAAQRPWDPPVSFRVSQVLGPTVQTLASMWSVFEDWASLRHDWTTAHAIRKLMIGQNLWYLDRVMDQIERTILRGNIGLDSAEKKQEEMSNYVSMDRDAGAALYRQ